MPARSSASESPRVVRCLLAVLALVLLVGPASAQITDIQPVEPLDFEEDLEFPWLLVGVTGFAGASGVAMDDLNEAVRLLNLEIAAQGSEGISYDSFGSVVSLGTGIRAIVLKRWVVQTDFERLIRSAQVGGVTSNSEIRIPANVITTSLSFDLLAKQTLGMGAGLGLAWYSSRAEQVVRRTRPGQDEEELGRVKLEGSAVGPVFQGYFE
ncbi:MAG TPA: hypothetical protein VKU85_20640, partial [bacterium]|nr:hypothetical protein [bacterium]